MIQKNLKIIFFGTPEFAAVILGTLIKNKFNITAIFSQPDKKIGRQQKIDFSAVKKLALEHKIKIYQPENLRDGDAIKEIREINPDLIAVAAYGKILPKGILDIPKYGAINIHASLLPKYRGASPVQCAILAGEKETGITLMQMNEKMDEGDIQAQEKIEIGRNETADNLLNKLAKLGGETLVDLVPKLIEGKIKAVVQDHQRASYCKPVKREDGKIDWTNTAEEIFCRWRAYQPWPGIFSILTIKNQPKRLKLLEIGIISSVKIGEETGKILKHKQDIAVQTKKGLIILRKIQLEGKKEMAASDFARGYPEFLSGKLE